MRKTRNLLLAGLLALSATAGCTKTEIRDRYIQPECSAPTLSPLPAIDAGDLWDKIGQEQYDALMQRERLIVDWALEMQSMIDVLCKSSGG